MFWAKSDYITCARDWEKVHRKYLSKARSKMRIGRTHGRMESFLVAVEVFLNLHKTRRARCDCPPQRLWQGQGEVLQGRRWRPWPWWRPWSWQRPYSRRWPWYQRRLCGEDEAKVLRREVGSGSCPSPLQQNCYSRPGGRLILMFICLNHVTETHRKILKSNVLFQYVTQVKSSCWIKKTMSLLACAFSAAALASGDDFELIVGINIIRRWSSLLPPWSASW